MRKGWLVFCDPCEVIPEGDLMVHGSGLDCLCEPRLDGDVIVHHAFDQREDVERGGLRPVAGYATFRNFGARSTG